MSFKMHKMNNIAINLHPKL